MDDSTSGPLVGEQCGKVGGGQVAEAGPEGCVRSHSLLVPSPGQSTASFSEPETQTCGLPEVFFFFWI